MVEEVHELGKDGEDEGKPDEDEEEDENEEAPALDVGVTGIRRGEVVEDGIGGGGRFGGVV